MINANDLWKKRSIQYTREVSRYLKYILNGHLLIVLVFLAGGAAYNYNLWLEELPENFPYALIIGVVLAFILTNSNVVTLLKEPDLVFLLPIEKKLSPYFQKAFFFSWILQSYLLLLLFAIIAPLYFKATGNGFSVLVIFFAAVLIVKVWNLLVAWYVHFYNERWARNTDFGVRLFLNFMLCYFLFSGANIFFVITTVAIMVFLLAYFQKTTATKGLKWDVLIDIEARRMMTFYRLANLFTDVPMLKERVKRRKWLDWVTKSLAFSKENTFQYLYLRTFLRSSDYFGLYLRLTIIGGLILALTDMEYGKVIVGLLFLYLTGYQLMTLWRHHHLKIWVDLYPVQESSKIHSFLRLMLSILMLQVFLLALCMVISAQFIIAILFFVLGGVFTYLFVFYYVKGKTIKLK